MNAKKDYYKYFKKDKTFHYDKNYIHLKAYEFFKKFNCKKILDAGCGHGHFINLNPQKISGIEGNEESVKICKEKKLNVRQGDVTDLSTFPDNSFDGIYASSIIEHLFPKEAYKMLCEFDRILRKNGILVIFGPLMHENFYHDFTHIRPYPPRALEHYLNENEKRQSTLNSIKSRYKKEKVFYRYKKIRLITNIMHKLFNIVVVNLFKKNASMIVFKKLD